ncbi:unnamed protein product [Brachionus calyciflorus]|uniref:Uncharacterized protein n=1 Tax=Brachionus calyciflorus TaxID=104777 RepID=A0A814AWL1_9BILA|nr:unnamed protein product [Brachionus calyciflorus]
MGWQFNSGRFQKNKSRVTDYSWLIASIEDRQANIFNCLQQCNLNYYCSYEEHNSTNCNMLSEYVSNFLVSSNSKIIYKKVDFSMKFSTCSNSNEFWSLKLNKCLPCPFDFARRADLPHACFRLATNTNNFATGKSNCKIYGASLPRPKTAWERVYRWGDGTRVGGFGPGEPNNQGSNTTLQEKFLILADHLIYDADELASRDVICQYT